MKKIVKKGLDKKELKVKTKVNKIEKKEKAVKVKKTPASKSQVEDKKKEVVTSKVDIPNQAKKEETIKPIVDTPVIKTQVSKTSSEPSNMEELLQKYGTETRAFRRGQMLEGTVVSVGHNQVLVDVGAKSEGIISGEELLDEEHTHKKLKEGDQVLVSVVQAEDKYGYLVLSLKRTEKERKWRVFERIFKDKTPIAVRVLEYAKGGLLVDALGQRGFIPISHLERTHFANFSKAMAPGSTADLKANLGGLKGKELKARVIEIDRAINRLVLSEKEAVSRELKEEDSKLLHQFKPGEEYTGVVSGIMPFGLFVEIEKDGTKIDGLVHISEISWEKVYDPSRIYKVGDKVQVKVLEINENESRIQLSIKALTDNPWVWFAEKYPIGSKVKGVVTKIVPFGAFVSVSFGEKGKEYKLDGLIHISETSGPLKEGETVEAVVTILDTKEQKLGLSARQVSEIRLYK